LRVTQWGSFKKNRAERERCAAVCGFEISAITGWGSWHAPKATENQNSTSSRLIQSLGTHFEKLMTAMPIFSEHELIIWRHEAVEPQDIRRQTQRQQIDSALCHLKSAPRSLFSVLAARNLLPH
jgi:hypothetical protein